MFHPNGPTFVELARQALSSTREGYDLLGPKFDFTPFRTPDDLLDALAERLGPPASVDAALDLCCGTGAGLRILRPLARSHVTGLDFSPGMLAVAQSRIPSWRGAAAVRLVEGDAFALPFEAEFDLITCFGALGHVLPKDEPAFLDGIWRALRPGGRFVFLTHDQPTPLHPGWWLARGFNAAMHVRNAVVDPPFIMFYLTFTLPEIADRLRARGFEVQVDADFTGRYRWVKRVSATRPA